MRRFLGVLLVGMIAWPALADDVQKDKQALNGTWKVTKATRGGKTPPDTEKVTLLITEDEITPQVGDRKEKPAKYKLDASKSPKQIDLTPGGDMTISGIYEVKGDKLRLCFRRGGGERPASFDAVGEEIMYLEAEKQK